MFVAVLNRRAIAISQDPLGRMGVRLPRYDNYSATAVWARPLAGGAVAVGCYNKGAVDRERPNDPTGPNGTAADISFSFAEVGLSGRAFDVLDVWTGDSFNLAGKASFTAKAVPHHGTALFRLSKAKPS